MQIIWKWASMQVICFKFVYTHSQNNFYYQLNGTTLVIISLEIF